MKFTAKHLCWLAKDSEGASFAYEQRKVIDHLTARAKCLLYEERISIPVHVADRLIEYLEESGFILSGRTDSTRDVQVTVSWKNPE